jgi:phosphate transport system permease protein
MKSIFINLFNASVMLAFMDVLTIGSISGDAIYGVTAYIKEESMALGATHSETIARMILPPGILPAGRLSTGWSCMRRCPA